MNRPIKFRSFDSVGSKMVYNIQLPMQKMLLNDYFKDANGWVWMQFTGLHDRNGVELFEGDTVKFKGFFGLYEEWLEGTIVFDYGSFVIQFKRDIKTLEKDLNSFYYKKESHYVSNIGDVHDRSDKPMWNLQVTGNIWEGPKEAATSNENK